MMSMYKLYYII